MFTQFILKMILNNKDLLVNKGINVMLTKVETKEARKNFEKIIEEVNQNSKPVYIQGSTDNKSAVVLSKKYYDALQETLATIKNGQLAASIERQNDEYVDVDSMIRDIDEKGK